jgi:plastocyanin
VQRRFAAILIALCLLIGIAGFSFSLSEALGISARESVPLPDTSRVPPTDSPTAGASGTAVPSPGRTASGTTPILTPTKYIEQDAAGFAAPSPSLPATSPATTVPTSVPSAPVDTEAPTQPPTRPGTGRTPRATDTTVKVPLSASEPTSITARLCAQDDRFSPSSITVPAGAEVTIVFDNQDVDIPHNVVVYADKAAPIFVGTVIRGPARTTDTFTAPSIPGTYVLGCGIPSPHRMGTFVVE